MVDKAHPQLISISIIEDKLTIRGRTIPYIVKCSIRARRVHLEIRRDAGLTVVISKLYCTERLHNRLKEKELWIPGNIHAYDKLVPPPVRKEITGHVRNIDNQ
ncbi:hypothetical protein ACFLUF_03470 [Chloroflexota bacterium]